MTGHHHEQTEQETALPLRVLFQTITRLIDGVRRFFEAFREQLSTGRRRYPALGPHAIPLPEAAEKNIYRSSTSLVAQRSPKSSGPGPVPRCSRHAA